MNPCLFVVFLLILSMLAPTIAYEDPLKEKTQRVGTSDDRRFGPNKVPNQVPMRNPKRIPNRVPNRVPKRNPKNVPNGNPNEDVLIEILPRSGKPPDICPKGWGRRAGYGQECVRED